MNIEYFTLTLDRKIATTSNDMGKYEIIEEKAPPIIITATNLIPDVVTTFPKDTPIEEIVGSLCTKLMDMIKEETLP